MALPGALLPTPNQPGKGKGRTKGGEGRKRGSKSSQEFLIWLCGDERPTWLTVYFDITEVSSSILFRMSTTSGPRSSAAGTLWTEYRSK